MSAKRNHFSNTPDQSPRINSCAPEVYEVLAPIVSAVVLLISSFKKKVISRLRQCQNRGKYSFCYDCDLYH